MGNLFILILKEKYCPLEIVFLIIYNDLQTKNITLFSEYLTEKMPYFDVEKVVVQVKFSLKKLFSACLVDVHIYAYLNFCQVKFLNVCL